MPPVVGYIAAALVSIGVAASVATIIATVIVDAVISFALGKIARALAGTPSNNQGPPQQSVTVKGTLEPRRILYGQVRTSGVVAFYGTSSSPGGSSQDYLWFVIALAGHQVDAIGDVILDSTTIVSANINSSTGAVTQGAFTGNLNIWRLLGPSTEVVQPDWNAAFTAITTNHIGYGVAKLVIRMKRSTTAWPNGAPSNFQALVSGKRVYDPRLDSTNGGSGSQRLNDATTWTFSANPALCAADYMYGGSIYFSVATPISVLGMKVPTNRINWTFVAAAANECDQSVALPGSTTQLRYVLGCVLSCGDIHDTNLDVILAAMIGQRIFSQGMYRIYAGEYDAPGVSISDADLSSDGYTIQGTVTGTDLYNTVVATYFDPNRDWQNVQCAVRTQSTYVTADGGQTLLRNITLAGVTDEYRAQRICEVIKKQSRNQIVATLNLKLTGAKVAPWETFNLTLAEQGWQNKVFRAQSVVMDLANRRVVVTGKEESSTPYADPLTTDYAAPGTVAPASTVEAPDDPTGLAAASDGYGISFTWNRPSYEAPGTTYELWEYTSSTPFASATKIASGIAGTAFWLAKSDTFTRYYWIRAVSLNGSLSNQYPGVTGIAGAALYGTGLPSMFAPRGLAVVSDQNVYKNGGASAWTDADAYSINHFPTAHLVWKANATTKAVMAGLVTAIPATINFTNLLYAMYADNSGIIEIYESGTQVVANAGAYTTKDYLAITYDGTSVIYWKNGAALRIVTVSLASVYGMFVLFSPGVGINSVEFGPTELIPGIDTPQLGANAATAVGSVFNATATTYTTSGTGFQTVAPAAEPTLSFAAPLDGNHVLIATLYVEGVTSSGAFTGSTNVNLQMNQVGNIIAGPFYSLTTTRLPFTIQEEFALIPGQTVSVAMLVSQGLTISATFNNFKLQGEIVKR
ncbi:MAG TPA: phage tail protein [Bradyrhizobium sp.]|jgi:hypothetical protein